MIEKAYYRSFQAVFNIGARCLYWRRPVEVSGTGSSEKIPELLKKYEGAFKMYPGKVPRFDYILKGERGKKVTGFKPAEVIDQLRGLFADMKAIRLDASNPQSSP